MSMLVLLTFIQPFKLWGNKHTAQSLSLLFYYSINTYNGFVAFLSAIVGQYSEIIM